MNPVHPCPHCGKATDFHDDEVEGLADGTTICMTCGMELEEAAFITEVIAGKHPEFVEEMLSREEDDEEEQADDE